jgi:TonB family protein
MIAMRKRMFLLLALLICSYAGAQEAVFPHKEIFLAESDFIDTGPPFDFYNLYRLTATAHGTDIERVSITPAAGSCALPTIEMKIAHMNDGLSNLLAGKDPCSIGERAARKEAKRCKHCLTFSGVHLSMQLSCGGTLRTIKYEVLDRNLFAEKPNTPAATSRSLDLLTTLNKAFGGGAFDKPVFSTAESQSAATPVTKDTLITSIANGDFDHLFGEKVSQLYIDSLGKPRLPTIELVSAQPMQPIQASLPAYPPIARAAHVEGTISITLKIDPTGQVSDATYQSGPRLFETATTDAAKRWLFPQSPEKQETIDVTYRLNCQVPSKR